MTHRIHLPAFGRLNPPRAAGYREIEALLRTSTLSAQVQRMSLSAFHALAVAEAR